MLYNSMYKLADILSFKTNWYRFTKTAKIVTGISTKEYVLGGRNTMGI
ncbi:MAG: hypothetical protein H7A23_24365 [Leptospiraceae bacterium]|nr:hypothetical protein [Leptospiraceae bacterium]MCP5497700.1 hypothetical protein [Leptospiraceae bacterium]